jgi:hypothetical protein
MSIHYFIIIIIIVVVVVVVVVVALQPFVGPSPLFQFRNLFLHRR